MNAAFLHGAGSWRRGRFAGGCRRRAVDVAGQLRIASDQRAGRDFVRWARFNGMLLTGLRVFYALGTHHATFRWLGAGTSGRECRCDRSRCK